MRESRMSEGDAAADLLQHLEQVKEIFDSIDPSGRRGLNYEQFKTVLVDILKIELDPDDPEQLEGILDDLDPKRTGYVQFEALHKQWTQ